MALFLWDLIPTMKLFQTEEEILAMHEEPPMPQFKTTFGDFLKKEGLYVLLAWKPLFV